MQAHGCYTLAVHTSAQSTLVRPIESVFCKCKRVGKCKCVCVFRKRDLLRDDDTGPQSTCPYDRWCCTEIFSPARTHGVFHSSTNVGVPSKEKEPFVQKEGIYLHVTWHFSRIIHTQEFGAIYIVY